MDQQLLGDRAGHGDAPGPVVAARAGVNGLGRRLTSLTVEQIAWLALIVLAAVTRFWDLGSRALMHDESIHTYYPWLLYEGEGYVHDPLSHGPFLFHAGALMYFLFGDSDMTSRIVPAIAGVLIVAAPWLLRGPAHLGRYGALAAGTMLLISPSILYYTRFIRHDPYTVLGTLLLVVAIFRFIERPERRWLLLGGGMLGFLYTNHEIVYAIAAVFVGIIALATLLGPLRALWPVVLGAGAAMLAVVVLWRGNHSLLGGSLPLIPWDSSGPVNRRPTPENQRQFYVDLLTHPLVLSLLLIVVLAVVAAWLVIRRMTLPEARQPGPDGYQQGWVEVAFARVPQGALSGFLRDAWRDRIGLQLAALIAIAICVVLFTTLFTNLGGLATGTIATDGALLYWLGQQDVQRGEQPWFYFLVMAPQYELLALAFAIPAVVLTAVRGARVALGRAVHDRRLTFRIFVTLWAIGITAGLSYAGEKMPWLIIHIALPLILLAGSLVDELVERWVNARSAVRTLPVEQRPRAGFVRGDWPIPAIAGALLILGGAWLLLAARLSAPQFVEVRGTVERTLMPGVLDDWWQLIVPPVAAIAVIAVGIWLAGMSRAARATLTALFIGLLLLQVHQGVRLSFRDGDVARDSLIYNTTTPDVTRMMSDLERMSFELYGDRSMPIQYGDDVNWPLYWYMRDFSGSYFQASADPNSDVPIIILPSSAATQAQSQLGDRYTAQNYVLRWHEPEDAVYRQFAIAPELPPNRSAWGDESNPHGPIAILESIWSSVMTQTTPEGQQHLWRLIFYREMPERTIDFPFTIFIRNDLLPIYDDIHYDQPMP